MDSIKDRFIRNRYLLEFRIFKKNRYFIKHKHLGDIVRTLPVISLFKECYPLEGNGRIVVLTTENKAGLMEMNADIDEVRILPEAVLKDFEKLCKEGGNPDNLFRDHYSAPEICPIYKLTQEDCDKHPDLLEIPDHIGGISEKKAKVYLRENGLDPSKTLLLVPYSGSASSIDPARLEPVIDLYRSSGYRVLTNVFGDGEKAAEGTESFSLPADVMFSAIRQGMTVIGVQCGLLDVCEWMHLTDKMIKIFMLKTKQDRFYYSNRAKNPDQKIEKKEWGYSVAVSTDQDYRDLRDQLVTMGRALLERD